MKSRLVKRLTVPDRTQSLWIRYDFWGVPEYRAMQVLHRCMLTMPLGQREPLTAGTCIVLLATDEPIAEPRPSSLRRVHLRLKR